MKKLLNSKLFLIIVCAIVFGSIGVVAGNINASEVDYKNTKLDAAIDDLYERSTYTEYSGVTTVIPSSESQILETNDKLLKSDITIQAIPSSYKNLTTETTVAANNLLVGNTAYNQAGELITGTLDVNESLANRISNSLYSNFDAGVRDTDKTTSLSLSSGEYLVFGTLFSSGSSSNVVANNGDYDASSYISYTNGTCSSISSKNYDYSGNTTIKIGTTNTHIRVVTTDIIYRCTFSSNTTLTLNYPVAANTAFSNGVKLYAIKLN